MKKRLLSALLALCMVLTLLPGTVFAEEAEAPAEAEEETETPAEAEDERTAMIAPIVSYENGTVTLTPHELLPEDAKIYYTVNAADDYTLISDENLYTEPFKAEKDYVIRTMAAVFDSDSGNIQARSDIMVYKVGLTSLGTSAELEWGKKYNYQYQWTGADEEFTLTETNVPGMIAWKTASPNQNQARIYIYRVDELEPVHRSNWGFGATNTDEYRSIDDFIRLEPEDGTYYFTVQSIGDGISYNSSEIAVSETWTYTKPSKTLPAVDVSSGWTTWRWETIDLPIANWTAIDDETYPLYSYGLEFVVMDTETISGVGPEQLSETWGISETSFLFNSMMLASYP